MSWPVDMLARILLALSKLGRPRKPREATFVNGAGRRRDLRRHRPP